MANNATCDVLERDETPGPPVIEAADIRHQIKVDLIDKEVQSAATYSYLWMADQMGHIGIGLLIAAVAGALVSIFGALSVWWHWLVAAALLGAIPALKEVKDFHKFNVGANRYFAVDRKLLIRNATTATLYMLAGLLIGVVVAMPLPLVSALAPWTWTILGIDIAISPAMLVRTAIVVAIGALALSGAWWWLRQKIVWQKAALPYLSRLSRVEVAFAPAAPPVSDDPGPTIEAYIAGASKVDGGTTERPLLLLGPLGVGKTDLAAAIGTEAAFAGAKVRYVPFSKLAQSALAQRATHGRGPYAGPIERVQAIDAADAGPPNILYWQWRRAQLVIIDDIRPGLGERDYITLEEFCERFAEDRKLGADGLGTLRRRRSVWVIGVTAAEEPDWIAAFGELFGVKPLVVRMRLTERHSSGLEAIALRA